MVPIRPFLHYISILICVVIYPGGAVAVEIAIDHIAIVVVQGIWVIKLELCSWWVVDRSDGDATNVDGEYLNVVVLGN